MDLLSPVWQIRIVELDVVEIAFVVVGRAVRGTNRVINFLVEPKHTRAGLGIRLLGEITYSSKAYSSSAQSWELRGVVVSGVVRWLLEAPREDSLSTHSALSLRVAWEARCVAEFEISENSICLIDYYC